MQQCFVNFYVHRYIDTVERIDKSYTKSVALLLAGYMIVLGVVMWLFPAGKRGWAVFQVCTVFISSLFFLYRYFRLYHKQEQQRMDRNTPEQWQEEVEQLDVDHEELQLFLRLVTVMRVGATDEMPAFLAEALRSPSLAQLTFLRELNNYYQSTA